MKECRGVPDQRFLSKTGAQATNRIRSKEHVTSEEINGPEDPHNNQTTNVEGFFFASVSDEFGERRDQDMGSSDDPPKSSHCLTGKAPWWISSWKLTRR